MGAAAVAAFRCWTVLRAVCQCLSAEDLFSFARCDALWEEVTVPLLRRRLRFFVLFQEQFGSLSLSQAFTEELDFRLNLAQKAQRIPVLGIVFCSYKQYDAGCLASRFPEQTTVVQIHVEQPLCFTRCGDARSRSAYLSVLVLFRWPGIEIECERVPCATCRKAAAPTASIVGVKRKLQHRCANRTPTTMVLGTMHRRLPGNPVGRERLLQNRNRFQGRHCRGDGKERRGKVCALECASDMQRRTHDKTQYYAPLQANEFEGSANCAAPKAAKSRTSSSCTL